MLEIVSDICFFIVSPVWPVKVFQLLSELCPVTAMKFFLLNFESNDISTRSEVARREQLVCLVDRTAFWDKEDNNSEFFLLEVIDILNINRYIFKILHNSRIITLLRLLWKWSPLEFG